MSGATGYGQSNLDANTAYKNTLARLNQQRVGTLQQYGYQGDVDPVNGTITNMRVDPNNPYGNLQAMLRSQAQQHQTDLFATEDRGLHGGLANQVQSQDKYNDGQQSAALGSALTDTMGGYQDSQNTAAYNRDAALAAAEQAAAEQAILNQAFDTPNFDDPNTDPGVDPWAPPQTNPRAAKIVALKSSLPSAAARIVRQSGYDPMAYVPGGSSTKKAIAIQQNQGVATPLKGYTPPKASLPTPKPATPAKKKK
jgi:hypothetical protein